MIIFNRHYRVRKEHGDARKRRRHLYKHVLRQHLENQENIVLIVWNSTLGIKLKEGEKNVPFHPLEEEVENPICYEKEDIHSSDSDSEQEGEQRKKKQAKLTPWEKGCLRKILSGAIVHGRRARHLTKNEDDMYCKFIMFSLAPRSENLK